MKAPVERSNEVRRIAQRGIVMRMGVVRSKETCAGSIAEIAG
jgi:hypothetical protein